MTTSSMSRSTAAVAAAALAILTGGAAIGVSSRAQAGVAQPQIRLAAGLTLNASVEQGCGSGHDRMSVAEVLGMVIAPRSPQDVENADANDDNFLCVTVASGGRVTDLVDNRSGSSGGSDEGSRDDEIPGVEPAPDIVTEEPMPPEDEQGMN